MTRGRPPKSLAAHVRDATFIASRHAALLDRQELGPTTPRALRELQERYRSTASKRVRAAIAVEFSEAVRAGGGGRRLTFSQAILGQVGPIQVRFDEVDDWFELDAAWEAWDAEHGVRWRILHDEALESDLEKAAATTDTTADEEWPPDPPAWDLVSRWGKGR